MPSVRASQPAQLWLALGYLGIVALMRGASDGPVPGFLPLVILPACGSRCTAPGASC